MAEIQFLQNTGSEATDVTLPQFSGNYKLFGNEEKGGIECYDSGVLTFSEDVIVDLFLIGGGGGGGKGKYDGRNSTGSGAGGGGSGYTKNIFGTKLLGNTPYTIVIGSGGVGGIHTTAAAGEKDPLWNGQSGGSTSINLKGSDGKDIVALGGQGGETSDNGGSQSHKAAKGGDGGSGGGSGEYSSRNSHKGGNGGSNGSDGENTLNGPGFPAKGQNVPTYPFLDTTFTLVGGGGGGGTGYNGEPSTTAFTAGKGGLGGGGNGGSGGGFSFTAPTPGLDHTGSGGGGASGGNSTQPGASGGSGILIIRWGYPSPLPPSP